MIRRPPKSTRPDTLFPYTTLFRSDLRFLTGEGQYSDDIRLEGQCHGVLVRSPFAHATIASIDLAEAKAAPGVLGVFMVDDLDADGVGDRKSTRLNSSH